jgi:biotin operon repressor
MHLESQPTRVLKLLKKSKYITARQVINLTGITRLAARIKDLRDAGFEIDGTERDQYHFTKYRLVK